MIGVANGVMAGRVAGAAADGGDDADRLNCPIISHEAANKRMPPAIRKSSRETRHDAATPVITKAINRDIAIAAVVPLSARARAADGVKFWVIEKKAGTVLIGPNVNMKMVKMNAGVIISIFPSGAVPARPRTARPTDRRSDRQPRDAALLREVDADRRAPCSSASRSCRRRTGPVAEFCRSRTSSTRARSTRPKELPGRHHADHRLKLRKRPNRLHAG